ncbi:MAG: hypothetical protein AB7V22_08530 [Kiritimatiellia bacterium]
MKIGWVMLGVGLGMAAGARAEDMKILSGQVYSNVLVLSYDRAGYAIRYDGGTNLVPYADVAAELRGHYKALSLAPIPASRLAREKEAPAGPDDLATLSGEIYRNVILKAVEPDYILIAHDTGMAKVSFSSIPLAEHDKYRTGLRAVPDPALDADDLETAYGQVFRNVEIVLEEPDGLTFRHDGGVTKVGFLALKEDLRQKYNYSPIEGWKYARDRVAQKALAEQEAAAAAAEPQSVGPTLVEVKDLETEAMPDDTYRISFTLSNLTDQPHSVAATVRDAKRLALISRTFDVPAHSGTKLLQIDIPTIKPAGLLVVCGTYRTNVVLSW